MHPLEKETFHTCLEGYCSASESFGNEFAWIWHRFPRGLGFDFVCWISVSWFERYVWQRSCGKKNTCRSSFHFFRLALLLIRRVRRGGLCVFAPVCTLLAKWCLCITQVFKKGFPLSVLASRTHEVPALLSSIKEHLADIGYCCQRAFLMWFRCLLVTCSLGGPFCLSRATFREWAANLVPFQEVFWQPKRSPRFWDRPINPRAPISGFQTWRVCSRVLCSGSLDGLSWVVICFG